MRKILFLLLLLPCMVYSQTYHSSETKYFGPKETEQIDRTITISTDTITIVTKGKIMTDIQKLVINYSSEGKMDRIGKAMIYQCSTVSQPFIYDIGVQLKDEIKKIGVTEVDLIKKKWRNMIFLID